MARSLAAPASPATVTLGSLGIIGGTVLLAAFVIDIPPGANTVRLLLFSAGAIAVVVGVHRRQAATTTRLALLGLVPAAFANAWYMTMTILSLGRPAPFAGDFGFVYFIAAITMWVSDALFGLVALRLGAVSRLGALVLAAGSVLAITGIDRLELTSIVNPTILGPIALAGVALNGVGWILLGLDLVIRFGRTWSRGAVRNA